MELMKLLEEKSSSTNRLRFPSEDGNSPVEVSESWEDRNLRRDAPNELMVGQVETGKPDHSLCQSTCNDVRCGCCSHSTIHSEAKPCVLMLARLSQVQPQIQKYRTRKKRCLKLQEVLAHNQWTPCLCLMLPFNDNAKFINEVHGINSHGLVPSQDRLVFHVYLSRVVIKKKAYKSPMVDFGN
ncbi:hypothetical protein NC651_004773 [Populus alba x Populus x berolinensis]|nr:hypothetical protein NC651_004773 [Populus alba x Populus x berolinensis]